jgi:hypothetical protein
MDLKLKSWVFVGTVIGTGIGAMIAHTSAMSPGWWLALGVGIGWCCRSRRDV